MKVGLGREVQLRHRKVVAGAALFTACIAPFAPSLLFGRESPSLDVMEVALSKAAYAPGDTVLVGLHLKIPPGYHLYGNPLGAGIGRPISIRIEGAAGVEWVDIKKAPPKKFIPVSGPWVWVYEKEAVFFPRGVARTVGNAGGSIIIDALICNTSCYPLHCSIPFTVRIDSAALPQEPFASNKRMLAFLSDSKETMTPGAVALQTAAVEAASPIAAITGIEMPRAEAIPAWHYRPREMRTGFHLLTALLFAFLAGIILNAMPCVLPVLGIKILSFSRGNESSASAWVRSLVFASGMLAVFMLLAVLTAFANYTWGKQFQDPRALTAIIAIIVVFALGLFDVYTLIVPAGLANLPQGKEKRFAGHFFQGVFTTLLATPCSGPFLGAVLAWSVTQTSHVIFLVYGALGLGMSFPYVLLSTNRFVMRWIPKPGRWMEDGKRIMGFLLLAFAAYLLAGLPAGRIAEAVLFCIAVAFAVVFYVRLAPWNASFPRKLLAVFASIVIIAGGGYLSFVVFHPAPAMTDSAGSQSGGQASAIWNPFSADSLIRANKEGRSAIVDFTAAWCLNCQYTFITALNTPEVIKLIRQRNILALRADMTMPDPIQDSLLHNLGSQSLPFLAIFPGKNPYEPIVMRDIVKKTTIIKTLRELK
jgi:thiol:disulfide interchange protein